MELFDEYILIQPIGDWGWGEVFLAVHAPDGRAQKLVWLVKLRKDLPLSASDFVANLQQLLGVLQKELSDPILTLPVEMKLEGPTPYFVYEPLVGRSLRQIVSAAREQYMPITIDHALLIMNQVNSGLQLLHQIEFRGDPVFHGLISPDQIYVTDEGQVKVIFDGIFRCLGAGETLPSGLIERLRSRLAPEQLKGHPGGPRSDVFQSARLTLELFQNAFLDENPENVRAWLLETRFYKPSGEQASLPDELLEVFLQALQTEPSKRFSKIEKFKEPLDELTFSGEYEASTFNLAFFVNTLAGSTFEELHSLYQDLLKQDYEPVLQAARSREEAAELESSLNEFAEELETEVIQADALDLEAPEEVIELESTEAESDVIMPDHREEDLYPSMKKKEAERRGFPVIPILIGLAVVFVAVGVYLMQKPSSPPEQKPAQQVTQPPKPNPEVIRLQQELEKQREQIAMLSELLKKAQEQPQDEKETQSTAENERIRKQLEEALNKVAKLEEELRRQQEAEKETEKSPVEIAKAQDQQPPQPSQPESKTESSEQGGKNVTQPTEITPATEQAQTTPVNALNEPTGELPTGEQAKQEQAPETKEVSQPPEPQPEEPAASTREPSGLSESEKPPQPQIKEPVLAASTDQGSEGLKPLPTCRPDYPPLLRRQNISGTVIYQVVIDRNGRVQSVKILRSPHKLMADAVREALTRRNCQFPRATVNGRPVRARITGTFIFKP